MLDKVKSKIELNKKTFYKLFLEPLTQNNYTKQSIWNLREIKIKDGNSIVEFTSFLIEKNWDINLEHLSSQESECAQGLIFYALDEHYTNCLKFKPEEITPELTALYKKVAKQTNLNQMPCGNPLYFEAFDTLTQLDIKAKETLDFSLKNYDNNNFLAFKVRYAPSTYEKEYKDYLFNLTKCLFHPINVNEKNNNGHSFANYALSLFLACFGSSFFDDNIKTHKKEIINLVDTMFTNHYIDLNSTFNDNETLEKKLNKSHLNNEGKILIEKWQLDNKLNTIQESKVGKKLKI